MMPERAIKLYKNNKVDHFSNSNKLVEAIWCASIEGKKIAWNIIGLCIHNM